MFILMIYNITSTYIVSAVYTVNINHTANIFCYGLYPSL